LRIASQDADAIACASEGLRSRSPNSRRSAGNDDNLRHVTLR
jgi:hypothetical protein